MLSGLSINQDVGDYFRGLIELLISDAARKAANQGMQTAALKARSASSVFHGVDDDVDDEEY